MNNTRMSNLTENVRRHTGLSSIVALLLLLALPAAVHAQFTYSVTNGTVTITGYIGPGGDVSIPSTINGLPVTSIGNWAFENCVGVTHVTIGNSVTNIGKQAFLRCSGLTSVVIPDSVASLGAEAFSSCTSLTTVSIGSRVPCIPDDAFSWCRGLAEVTIGSAVASIGSNAFCSCTSLASLTIPDTVTSIGERAFWQSGLTNVAIGNNVTTIADGAFGFCGLQGAVTLPNSITSLGQEAFERCAGLTSVTIGNRLTTIGARTFAECYSLTSIRIPDSVTDIGAQAFIDCWALTRAAIGSSVTNIGYAAFGGCVRLGAVTLPNSVIAIGDAAFCDCEGVTNISLGNHVVSIGGRAFEYCPLLTSVTIPNSVCRIGDWAFHECYSLREVYFLGNAPSLGGPYVFSSDYPTIYYLPGTTGWGPTYGGLPTVLWTPPTIQSSPLTQTAEAGATVGFVVKTSSSMPLFCLWSFNATNLIGGSTNCELHLTNVQFFEAGAYTAVITNAAGAVTSSPAILQVIAPVGRRPVPGIQVGGQTGTVVNVDYSDSLSPTPNWTALGSISLAGTSPYFFDVSTPLPAQRFYRAWQMGTPPSLELRIVPAITLTGATGSSVRLDYINQFGPIDAWLTLDTVLLTNTTQLYFDTSAIGQPPRLWRLAPVP